MTNIVYTLGTPKKVESDLKISVVMQSFLGDYPGSRTNPEEKFIRAVKSFLDQSNKNTELVIVSDGCKITERLHLEHFSGEERIKYHFCDSGDKMYSEKSGVKFYRGTPRQKGVDLTTGDIITYMDSDDFLLKDFLMVLKLYWISNPQIDWLMNQGWFDNVEMIKNPVDGYFTLFEERVLEDAKIIEGLESLWFESRLKAKNIIMSPALTSHRKSCQTKWKDTWGNSEDKDFNVRLRKEYLKGGLFYFPGYVRCHLRDKWDW